MPEGVRCSPTAGEEPAGGAQSTLLILVISSGGAVADLFTVLSADPAVERALQSVGLRSHQIGRPQKRISSAGTKHVSEILLAGAGQDDRVATGLVLLLRNNRKLEIHEPVMPHVSHQARTPTNG